MVLRHAASEDEEARACVAYDGLLSDLGAMDSLHERGTLTLLPEWRRLSLAGSSVFGPSDLSRMMAP